MNVPVGIVIAVLLQCIGASEVHYEVPEPLFEVFSPKGLRVSVPDSRDVKSVEFHLVLPTCNEPLIQEVNRSNGRYWVYWNPDVSLQLLNKIKYKLMILHRGIYWKKEGTHVVQKIVPLSHFNETDCSENQPQKLVSIFPAVSNVEESQKGLVTQGKTSSFKSSYSTLKNSDLKPITKSSTSTTSGTFFVKPSGVMEATGFKKGSTFDSTKREGEQWEHYQSELTAEELENMKRLYESGLDGFPQLTDKFFPSSAKVYEKKYMTSESKSFPGEFHTVGFQSSPVTSHQAQFHQTHRTYESSSSGSHSQPFQFHYTGSAGERSTVARADQEEEKSYKLEPLTKLPSPLPPHGTIFKATEYVREEHTVPVGEVSQVDREIHRPTPQKIVQVSQSGEFSSRNQEIVKPVIPQISLTGRTNQFEYNSGNLQTVERQEYRGRHYVGNIFKSVKANRVKSPQECDLVPGVDYNPTGSLREVERYAYELGCLATLAEYTMKEEIAILKQKNAEYGRKLEQLEHEIKRLSSNCNCRE